MSDGDVDVTPYLNSRNTIGHGKPQLKFSNTKSNDGTEGYVVGLVGEGGGGRSGCSAEA